MYHTEALSSTYTVRDPSAKVFVTHVCTQSGGSLSGSAVRGRNIAHTASMAKIVGRPSNRDFVAVLASGVIPHAQFPPLGEPKTLLRSPCSFALRVRHFRC